MRSLEIERGKCERWAESERAERLCLSRADSNRGIGLVLSVLLPLV